jgi:hypothetical protein
MERLAKRLGLKPGPVFTEIFSDPSPDAIVNLRVAQPLIGILARLELAEGDRDFALDLLVLVCKKLVGAWRHLDAYTQSEARLMEEESARDLDRVDDVASVTFSQDLFLEFDEFLVQVKSTLDYVVKIPVPIVGRDTWRVHTFGDKGERVLKAAKGCLRAADRRIMVPYLRRLLGDHKAWLTDTIAARDRINHFLEGGVPYEYFLVRKVRTREGDTILVPKWSPDMPLREAMRRIWWRLIALVEDFAGGFMILRMPHGLGLFHEAVADGVARSPWKVVPDAVGEKLATALGMTVLKEEEA